VSHICAAVVPPSWLRQEIDRRILSPVWQAPLPLRQRPPRPGRGEGAPALQPLDAAHRDSDQPQQDSYQWTAKNPKQTLYVRVGKLAGVKKAGEGLYVAETVAGAAFGIVPETVAPPAETPFGQGF
jgi:hypothetical protein